LPPHLRQKNTTKKEKNQSKESLFSACVDSASEERKEKESLAQETQAQNNEKVFALAVCEDAHRKNLV
jgi:translation elongation factor EF-1alpha